MRIVFIFFIITSLIHHPKVEASEFQRLQLLSQDVELRIRLFNTMIQTNERLLMELDELERGQYSQLEFDQKLTQNIKSTTEEYIATQLRISGFDSREIGLIKRHLQDFKWSQIGPYFYHSYQYLRSFGRLHGMNFLAVMVLTNIIQMIIPFFITIVGHPIVAIVALKLPTTLPVIYLYNATSNYVYKTRMTHLLGGEEAFREYERQQTLVQERLNLHSADDIFIPLSDDTHEALVWRKPSYRDLVARPLGLAPDLLTTSNIRNFLVSNDISDPLLWGLINDSRLSEKNKIAMLAYHLYYHPNQNHFLEFKTRFSQSFVNLSSRPAQFETVLTWIKSVLRSKSSQDIEFYLRRAPTDVSSRELLAAFEKIILPALAQSEQLSYNEMRQLDHRIYGLKAILENDSDLSRPNLFIDEMVKYYKTSLNSGIGACYRTLDEVIWALTR